MKPKENTEQKYRFFHNREWVEMTKLEIDVLPFKIKTMKEDLAILEYLQKASTDALKQTYQNALKKYFTELSKHMFVLDNGYKIKYVATLIERPHSPNFFVLAEIRFDSEDKIHSLSLTQVDINNTTQIVNYQRMNLFGYKNKKTAKCKKEIKQKFARVADVVKTNFVEKSQSNYEKCNTILRGWIAQMF